MFITLLFVLALFLPPQAEAHRGNPCLPSDYTDGTCQAEETLKSAIDHVDSTRIYDEDEDHRHKPRALGVPGESYDRTFPEDVPEGTVAVNVPFYDRDLQIDHQTIDRTSLGCREISTSLFLSYPQGRQSKFIYPHPFVDEGFVYVVKQSGGLNVVELDFSRNGPVFDYERAPHRTEDGRRYYEYTVTAWEEYDMNSPCQRNVEGWHPPDPEWQISRTFRMYVTDVDETINQLPELSSSSLIDMGVFENLHTGMEVCCNDAEVTDRDHDQEELVYELIGEDASDFRITSGRRFDIDRGGHGNGRIYTTQTFDYETKSSYSLTFRVSDPAGGVAERDFTIQIIDLVKEGCSSPSEVSAPWTYSSNGSYDDLDCPYSDTIDGEDEDTDESLQQEIHNGLRTRASDGNSPRGMCKEEYFDSNTQTCSQHQTQFEYTLGENTPLGTHFGILALDDPDTAIYYNYTTHAYFDPINLGSSNNNRVDWHPWRNSDVYLILHRRLDFEDPRYYDSATNTSKIVLEARVFDPNDLPKNNYYDFPECSDKQGRANSWNRDEWSFPITIVINITDEEEIEGLLPSEVEPNLDSERPEFFDDNCYDGVTGPVTESTPPPVTTTPPPVTSNSTSSNYNSTSSNYNSTSSN